MPSKNSSFSIRCVFVHSLLLPLCLAGLGISTAAGQTGDATTQTPAVSPAAAAAQADAARAAQVAQAKQLASKTLFDELSRLIPGDVPADSPAGEAVQLAVEAFIDRNAAKAETILEQQTKGNPTFPPHKVLMAALCFSAKDNARGARFLEQTAVDNPDHPSVYAAYGRLALAGNRNVDAFLNFEKVLALLDKGQVSGAAETHYENEYLDGMTQAASRLQRYELARQLIAQTQQRKPDDPKTTQILAEISFQEDKLEESLQHLNKLKQLRPEMRVPEAMVGTWFARKGQLDQANEWMNRIPGKYADDAKPLLDYATWSLNRESFAAAISAIEKIDSLGDDSPESKRLKAKLAFAQGQFDVAVKGYRELLDSNPNSPDYANMLALSLIEEGSSTNKVAANQLANKNLQANSNNRIAVAAAGYIRMKTAGVNPSIQALFQKIAKARDGRSPEIDYFLAAYLKKAGQNQPAAQLLKVALDYKGLFLYRRQAEQLLEQLASSATLPTPGQ